MSTIASPTLEPPEEPVAPPGPPPRRRTPPPVTSVLGAMSLETPHAKARALDAIVAAWQQHHEPIWQEMDRNWHFYNGNQWGYHSAALGSYVPLPSWSSDVTRRTVNKIRPNAEQMVSILTSERPVFGAVGGTSEVRDSAASEAADDLAEFIQRQFDFQGIRRRMARGAGVAGERFLLWEWDASAGPPVFDETSGMIAPAGDFRFTEMTHRQVIMDPGAMTWGEGQALFCEFSVPRFALRNAFPDIDVETIVSTSGDDRMRRVWELGGSGSETGLSVSGESSQRQSIVTRIGFVPRCAEFPFGLRVMFAGGILFEQTENPAYPTLEELRAGEGWPARPWPVTQFVHLEREGSAHGRGAVDAAIPLQQLLNGVASKYDLHLQKIANTKVFVPMNLTAEWTDEVGQVIPYARGTDLSHAGYKAPPPMTTEYLMGWNKANEELNDIFGINASSKGVSEAEDSGRKTIALQKRDIGRLEPVKNAQDVAEMEVLRGALFLFRRHATLKRKIDVVGENRRQAIRELDRTAILPNTNIILYNDRSIPRDPSERMMWLQSFIQSGVLQLPAEQRESIIQLMRLRDFKGFMEHQAPHRDRARRENLRLLNVGRVGVLEMDDDLIHMKVLEELILSEEFETNVEQELLEPVNGGQSPLWTRTFEHYQAHKAAFIRKRSAMGAAPPAPGGPGVQPGTPSGPEAAAPPEDTQQAEAA